MGGIRVCEDERLVSYSQKIVLDTSQAATGRGRCDGAYASPKHEDNTMKHAPHFHRACTLVWRHMKTHTSSQRT
jgi:hypothetical protein